MSIPANLRGRYAYHFTMLDNLDSIIENGLLSTNKKVEKGIVHRDVAEQSIQNRRHTMPVSCSNGKFVHDYVPFYFAQRTPMQLGIVNSKNIDQYLLIFFAVPIEVIDNLEGVIFTDASANTVIPPNFFNKHNSISLESLNWNIIDDNRWKQDTDQKRHQKMAELLIPDFLEISNVDYIVVWNNSIKEYIEELFKTKGINPPRIEINYYHYYLDFYATGKKSVITGPISLRREYEDTVQEICKYKYHSTKFHTIQDALTAIGNNFGAIKELSDIDNLQANYGPHTDDVGTHSRKVVNALTQFSHYSTLNEYDKDIVKISAYLHDIGKGPKDRWDNETMHQADNDHAVKSLPMLKRILTEDIGNLDSETVRKIVMLVTYDDLVGDIVAKSRDSKQLLDIITSENDVDMLFALGQADMFSINPWWLIERKDELVDLYDYAIESLQPNT